MKNFVIIVAGGKGLRMGADVPKQFLLLNGKPVLMHTIEAFYNYDSSIEIIVVIPENQQNYWRELCADYQFEISHRVTNGGVSRFYSVKNALNLIESSIERNSLIAVHDGVRPLINRELIARSFQEAIKGKAVCPTIPVVDSLRIKTRTGTRRVNRSHYFQVQTPQVFLARILLSAYLQPYCEEFTDDVSVVEQSRKCLIKTIEGSVENIKITTPLDLAAAETLFKTKCRT